MLYQSSLSLLIVGAGGHGRVVADAALGLAAPYGAVIATDADASKCTGDLLPGVPLLMQEQARLRDAVAVHIAIGHNAFRAQECAKWGRSRCVTVQHGLASVSRFANMEGGCFIAAYAIVAAGTRLGCGVIVNHAAVVDHDCTVDEFTHIAPNATLGGGVRIGKSVLVGAGAVILPGCKICDDVTIGAGAVITHDIQMPGVYAGIPARKIQS